MYYQYFGLTEAPFSIAVNPRYLYMSPRHRDALAHLLYGVGSGGGFILLTGEVGTGKTTINRCLLEQLPDNADIAIVLNPALDSRDLLATVCEELGIGSGAPQQGLKELTDSLHRFLLSNHAAGRKTVLMIDEAQHLGFEVLEQIRLLTNLETNDEKLLHIILIGQPELAAKLARPELRQLNQRITARFDLQPLSPAETGAYIRHRLQVAGKPAGQELFPPGLVRAIHRESRGVPRLINLLCDRILLGAYGRDSAQLDRSLLRQAVREVLGEPQAVRSLSRWKLPLAGAAAGVLVTLALWLLLAGGNTPPGGDGSPGPLPEDRDTAALNADPGKSETGGLPVPDTAGPAPARDLRVAASEAASPDQSAAWRLTPQAGAAALAALYGAPSPERANLCAADLGSRLACEQLELGSWNELLERGRPALLSLLDARRFESAALLVGFEDGDALLAAGRGAYRVPLERLAGEWTGSVQQLWRKPQGMERTLQRGDRGVDVARAAALFARLDGQQQPLSDGLFNEVLEKRVRLFQRRQGLRADGVMGDNTLRALALAAGEDMGFAEARQRVADNALSRVFASPEQ